MATDPGFKKIQAGHTLCGKYPEEDRQTIGKAVCDMWITPCSKGRENAGGKIIMMVEIYPGICGFKTTVEAKKIDKTTVEVCIKTDCPNIKKVADNFKVVKPYEELFCKLHETGTYKALLNGLAHPACLVPAGVLKAIEVASGLALPKNAAIQIIL